MNEVRVRYKSTPDVIRNGIAISPWTVSTSEGEKIRFYLASVMKYNEESICDVHIVIEEAEEWNVVGKGAEYSSRALEENEFVVVDKSIEKDLYDAWDDGPLEHLESAKKLYSVLFSVMKSKLKILGIILLSPLILLIVLVMIPVALIANLIDKPFRKRRLQRIKDDISANWLPNKKYLYVRYHSSSELAPFIDTEIMKKYSEHVVAYRWNEDKKIWDDSTLKRLSKDSDKTLFREIHPDFDDAFEVMVTYIDPVTREFSDNCLEIFPMESGFFALDTIENRVTRTEAESAVAAFAERSLRLWR